MPISDAQFAQFLKESGSRRVLLAEIDFVYQVIVDATHGTPTVGTVYLGDYPFVTEPGDTPANRRYRDGLTLPEFTQDIDVDTLGGRTKNTVGALVLDNTDGRFDFLLGLAVDGQECRFYLGDPSWPRADYRNVMTAIVQHVSAPAQNRIAVELRDRGLLMDASLQGAVIGDVGPNAGRALPIVCGYCNNLEAILIDSIYLKYGVADTAATPYHVYYAGLEQEKQIPLIFLDSSGNPTFNGSDLGSAFTVDTTANTILHPKINLAVDDIVAITTTASMGLVSGDKYYVVGVNPDRSFQLSSIRGGIPISLIAQFNPTEQVFVDRYPWIDNADTPATITTAHPAFGRVTVDVDKPISTNSRASDIIRYLTVDRAGLPSGNFSGPLASFTEDGASCDFKLGVAIPERKNLTDVLDDVLFSVNGFWGFDQFSNLVYGRIRPWDLGSLAIALELGSDDIKSIDSIVVDHLQPTYKSVQGFFQKSWTDQKDGFAGGVQLDWISYLTAGGLFYGTQPIVSTRYEDNPGLYHKTMIASPDYMTLISQYDCAKAFEEFKIWLEDRRKLTLPSLEILRLKSTLIAYALKLGDVVNVTLDRFGLDAGARFQLIGKAVSLTDAAVSLALIRRHVADVATTDYP